MGKWSNGMVHVLCVCTWWEKLHTRTSRKPEKFYICFFACLENEETLLKYKKWKEKIEVYILLFFLTTPSFRRNSFCLEFLLPREASIQRWFWLPCDWGMEKGTNDVLSPWMRGHEKQSIKRDIHVYRKKATIGFK